MPTVAQLIGWDGPLELELCAGASGLGREIIRVVHLGAGRLDVSLQPGDLVLTSVREWRRVSGIAADHSLDSLGILPVAAVVVALASSPGDPTPAISETWSTPVLFLTAPRLDQAEAVLLDWLSRQQQVELQDVIDLREAFRELGEEPTVEAIAERVTGLARKPVLLHDGRGLVDRVCQLISQERPARDFEGVVRAAAVTISRRVRQEVFPAIGMLYDEVPAAEVCLLTIVIGQAEMQPRYLSILVNPAESHHRDRAILAAALDGLLEDATPLTTMDPVEAPGDLLLGSLLKSKFQQTRTRATQLGYRLEGPHFGLALAIPPSSETVRVRECLCQLLDTERPLVREQDDYLLCLLPTARSLADHWERSHKLNDWHDALCVTFGPISMGASTAHTGMEGARLALIEARRALEMSDRLRGPGHLSHYPDMCVREFLLNTPDHGRLRALRDALLRPLAMHDETTSNDLVVTLETHLKTGCRTVQTAELLGVHRNSVLYRLQRIEELLHLDLEDADTRLLLQLAIRAADVLPAVPGVRPAAAETSSVEVVWSRGDGARLSTPYGAVATGGSLGPSFEITLRAGGA